MQNNNAWVGSLMEPGERVEAVMHRFHEESLCEETRIGSVAAEAVSAAAAAERRLCARLIEQLKDEYVDWCAIHSSDHAEQLEVAVKMLTRAAASIRRGLRES